MAKDTTPRTFDMVTAEWGKDGRLVVYVTPDSEPQACKGKDDKPSKNVLLASTRGFVSLPGGAKLSLNLIRPK